MGNIIRIKEGGLPKAFDAAKLRTNLQGGGNCLWIPKESVPVASKFITENGTYLAASEGLHGFSSLNVSSQPDYVVGNKSGKVYRVHKGGESGNELIYDEMPTEIRVTIRPEKVMYNDGEMMDYNGIVVTAYDSEGNVWDYPNYERGIIPFYELIFPVQIFQKNMECEVLEAPYKRSRGDSTIEPATTPIYTAKRLKLYRETISKDRVTGETNRTTYNNEYYVENDGMLAIWEDGTKIEQSTGEIYKCYWLVVAGNDYNLYNDTKIEYKGKITEWKHVIHRPFYAPRDIGNGNKVCLHHRAYHYGDISDARVNQLVDSELPFNDNGEVWQLYCALGENMLYAMKEYQIPVKWRIPGTEQSKEILLETQFAVRSEEAVTP